ncbi:MAG TPA: FAD binding domain-containing protein [Ilumatobacter sp.]|nr:FAD binding domain-containing protein [Ilumatobacter sp.]
MKPAPFAYLRPATVGEAVMALAEPVDQRVLAGGQSLLPLLNLRLARVDRLVDIGGLNELDRIFVGPDSVVLGALVRHRRVEQDPEVAAHAPLLAAAAAHIGYPAIRTRGTLGGSLAHADPTAELPAVVALLDGVVYLDSATGRREVAAEQFAQGHYSTAAADGELLTWVRVRRLGPGEGWGFHEYAHHRGDFALVGAAAVVTLDPAGRVSNGRAVLFGATSTPIVLEVGELLRTQPDAADVAELARAWCAAVEIDDHYRSQLAPPAVAGALGQAIERARDAGVRA